MKNKASKFLRNLFSVVVTIIKNKSVALRTKTAGLKTRLLLFGLLNNKKDIMSTISHKMQALITQERDQQHNSTGICATHRSYKAYEGAILPRRAQSNVTIGTPDYFEDMGPGFFEEGDDECLDLTHSLFNLNEEDDGDDDDDDDDEREDLELASSSITDFVKNSREDGSSFNLEDEIDHVAGEFIKRVHKQRWLQNLGSFKTSLQDMNA